MSGQYVQQHFPLEIEEGSTERGDMRSERYNISQDLNTEREKLELAKFACSQSEVKRN